MTNKVQANCNETPKSPGNTAPATVGAESARVRSGLLTFGPKTGSATVVVSGHQICLGGYATLQAAYFAAREDGHRPSRRATHLGAPELAIDQADHWDRLFEATP